MTYFNTIISQGASRETKLIEAVCVGVYTYILCIYLLRDELRHWIM